LGVVVSTNFFQTYVFWELVGVCSYLLIGHYYKRPAAAAAAKKAFIVTRFADFPFLVGIGYIFFRFHNLDFYQLAPLWAAGKVSSVGLFIIAVLVFSGAAGKSAQFPFHVWLPDAMEGPTPISALIHAATMVAAGVYLVARTYNLLEASAAALAVVATLGAATSLMSAIWAMGGLWRRMRITAWTMLIASLAAAGIPPLAGFWSKDAIMARVFSSGNGIWVMVALLIAFFSALYTFRLVFVVFAGEVAKRR